MYMTNVQDQRTRQTKDQIPPLFKTVASSAGSRRDQLTPLWEDKRAHCTRRNYTVVNYMTLTVSWPNIIKQSKMCQA